MKQDFKDLSLVSNSFNLAKERFADTADFMTGFEKNIFSSESSFDKDANRCKELFIAQAVPEISAKNTSFKISYMCIFDTHCKYLRFDYRVNHRLVDNWQILTLENKNLERTGFGIITNRKFNATIFPG